MTGRTLLHLDPKTISSVFRALRLALVVLVAFSLHAAEFTRTGTRDKESESQAGILRVGASLVDSVSGGETKEYSLKIESGQNLSLQIQKADLRLRVSACTQTADSCLEFVKRSYGNLYISFTASISTDYFLRISSIETAPASRRFELHVIEINQITPRGRMADAATATLSEAEILRTHQELNERLAAISKYKEAQRLWESAGESSKAAEALCSAGEVYFSLSNYREALKEYREALNLNRTERNQIVQLEALNGIGYMYANLGQNDEALPYAQKVLEGLKSVPQGVSSALLNRFEAQAGNTIGEVLYARRELNEAISMFSRTIPMWREAEDRRGEALALLNLGYSHGDLGDFRNASTHYEQARELFNSINDERGVALAQTANAGALAILGQPQLALDLHHEAVQHFRQTGNKQGEAASLNGIASAYEDLGEYQLAADNYLLALQIYRTLGNDRLVALNNFVVGRVLSRLSKLDDAEKYCVESLNLSRRLADKVIEANVHQSLAAIYFGRGDVKLALRQAQLALKLYRVNDNHWSEAYALNDIGHFQEALGETAFAHESYQSALPLMRVAADRHGEALTLANLSKIERDRGNLMEARTLVEESLGIAESVHKNLRNTQLKTSFFSTVHQYYEMYINILMRLHQQFPTKGYDRLALVANERSRARSLLDSLLNESIGGQSKDSFDLVAKELDLLRRLDEKTEQQRITIARKSTEDEINKLSQQIRSLTVEYQDVRAKLKEQNSLHSTLTQSSPLSAEDLQSLFHDSQTLLVEFALGDAESFVWTVGPDKITSYRLPERRVIESQARTVYDLVTIRQSSLEQSEPPDTSKLNVADREYWQQAQVLSTMLLGPIAFESGLKRLVIVADGFLQYIPFDALPIPNKNIAANEVEPLFLRYEVASVPSALTLSALRKPDDRGFSAGKTIAIFADPVFESNDPRVIALQGRKTPPDPDNSLSTELRGIDDSDIPGRISRLPSTLREAKSILDVTPPQEGEIRTGFLASKEQIVNGSLHDYRVIHFATHGLLNTEHPELSGIVLSRFDELGNPTSGFLRINDIYHLDLKAELIVLSACRSGVGKTVRGEGVVGLPSAFFYAGAKSVVASLWKVNDEATAEFMSHFYTALFRDGLPQAAALKKAKFEMWKQERWRSPFYWGAFVVQGEYSGDIGASQVSRLQLLVGSTMIILCALGAGLIVWRRRGRRII